MLLTAAVTGEAKGSSLLAATSVLTRHALDGARMNVITPATTRRRGRAKAPPEADPQPVQETKKIREAFDVPSAILREWGRRRRDLKFARLLGRVATKSNHVVKSTLRRGQSRLNKSFLSPGKLWLRLSENSLMILSGG